MLPQVRISPIYPGQAGVPGSDVQRGLRWESCGIVLYVDDRHPNATATADGTNPEYPLTTVALAVSRLTTFAAAMNISLEGSAIVVAAEATIAESVVVPPTAPANCMLIGAGQGRSAPTWAAATAAGTALTIQQDGWVVEGFHFVTGSGGTAIVLQWVPGSGYVGNRCLIRNNHFDGAWGGLYGIAFSGAPYDAWILNNEFREYTYGENAAAAITVTDTSEANPYMCVIKDNIFWENDNHITSLGAARGFNGSLFQRNVFNQGVLITATLILDLRGGTQGDNIVTGNVFPGDYSNTGGYYANAANPGNWNGNLAEDMLEAEVSDSGFTIAPPAA